MDDLRDPWLVAAWPGMGLVGHLAANFLAHGLGAEQVAELPADDHFDLARVVVKDGVLLPPKLPRTTLFGWRHPGEGRDLVVLLGERQPTANVRRFCDVAMDTARELGVIRAFTLAAMASPSPPSAPARVFAAATDAAIRAELREGGIELMKDGEIGGLNGVFLSTSAERGLPGACLLGEFPFLASSAPNPKASAAVLRAFTKLAGLELDLSELDAQAREVERQLTELMNHMEEAARAKSAAAADLRASEEIPDDWPEPEKVRALDPRDAARIETLFAEALRDRSKALGLKAELDRLGVFQRFEDRFLDLFKDAE